MIPRSPAAPPNLCITLAELARRADALVRGCIEMQNGERGGQRASASRRGRRCRRPQRAFQRWRSYRHREQRRGDGAIGPATLEAASRADIPATLARYADVRRAHYRSLSTFWRFGRGWLARVDKTVHLAQAIAADPRFAPQSTPKETPMTETSSSTTTTPAPEAKWWGQSMTIWGVFITSLSTVLPVIGPVLGLNITADLIHQLGDGVVQVVQASGGLIGTVLTVWGRLRATQPLVRTRVSLTL